MPRTLAGQYNTLFTQDAMLLATCVKIIRTDEVVIALTTADIEITDYEGGTPGVDTPIIYEPLGSVATSSLKQTADSGVDNMEAWGMLDSDRISEDDLRAGRYDNADVYVFLLDPSVNPVVNKITLMRARIGEVQTVNGRFTAELRSTTQMLKQTIGDITTPTCRVKRFGDSQCFPDGLSDNGDSITDFTFAVVAVSQADDFTIRFDLDTGVFWPVDGSGDYFNYGVVIFTSGDNDGIERELKSYAAVGMTTQKDFKLRTPFPFAVAPGDTAHVIAGCQRRFREDCIAKFNNAPNFHGEPEIPGNDTVIQTGRPPNA